MIKWSAPDADAEGAWIPEVLLFLLMTVCVIAYAVVVGEAIEDSPSVLVLTDETGTVVTDLHTDTLTIIIRREP